ncbi:MAG: ABC transporter ATP-binding protein [Chloroflexi bacterium]|nr:ABC transporter ATP-binding protein [Chloroflexota bacterium]
MVDASLRATILNSIRGLNRDLGISIVYITHDLTTAYHICDNVMVLYSGSVAEAGSSERVVKDARHPYTKLLIQSIPQPDPERVWGADSVAMAAEESDGAGQGCKFADRCPSVMAICRQSVPPLFRMHADQAASCFLHRDSQPVEGGDVAQIFALNESARLDAAKVDGRQNHHLPQDGAQNSRPQARPAAGPSLEPQP